MNNQIWMLLRGRWKALAPREKAMVSGAAVFLAGLLAWLSLIQPALKNIDYWHAETPKLRAQSQALALLLREVTTPVGLDLEHSLRQSLDAAGLTGHYRLQAQDLSWRLTLDAAPADAVLGWLLSDPRQFSLEVVEASLQRTGEASTDDTAGTLSGTVRMDQVNGAKEAS
jgi:general secretion pathway protein M